MYYVATAVRWQIFGNILYFLFEFINIACFPCFAFLCISINCQKYGFTGYGKKNYQNILSWGIYIPCLDKQLKKNQDRITLKCFQALAYGDLWYVCVNKKYLMMAFLLEGI